jgi:hypothetical protein
VRFQRCMEIGRLLARQRRYWVCWPEDLYRDKPWRQTMSRLALCWRIQARSVHASRARATDSPPPISILQAIKPKTGRNSFKSPIRRVLVTNPIPKDLRRRRNRRERRKRRRSLCCPTRSRSHGGRRHGPGTMATQRPSKRSKGRQGISPRNRDADGNAIWLMSAVLRTPLCNTPTALVFPAWTTPTTL